MNRAILVGAIAVFGLVVGCGGCDEERSSNSANGEPNNGGPDNGGPNNGGSNNGGSNNGGSNNGGSNNGGSNNANNVDNNGLGDADGDGILDGTEVIIGTSPSTPDEACTFEQYTASLDEKPVDIIVVIDNSGSMSQEIEGVEANINQNFADIIRASGLDFRVIMLSAHGDFNSNDICVSEPLSGTDCNPIPNQPVNTANFFHYDESIRSRDSFEKILETWDVADQHGFAPDGWREWLRDGAFKVFIEITDDAPSGSLPNGEDATAGNFDAALLALEPPHFGIPGDRNYVWHSIVGLDAKPGGGAWEPADPIVTDECPTGVRAAEEYQALSIATGGLRFPVCDIASYDAVFNEVAQGIIEQSRIGCELDLPPTPAGEEVDVDRMALQWTPTPADPTVLVKKVDPAACGVLDFYVEGNRIILCPDLCAEVAASTEGELEVFAACVTGEECIPSAPYEIDCNDGIDNDCDGFVDRMDTDCLM